MNKKRNIPIYIGIILIVMAIFSLRSFIVLDSSMSPTLEHGNHLIAVRNIGVIPTNNPIVIFKNDKSPDYLVKRVVGYPGDSILISEDEILVNNISIEARNLKGNGTSYSGILGEDEFFVLGDNNAYSLDSRTFGAIQKKDIIGIVILHF